MSSTWTIQSHYADIHLLTVKEAQFNQVEKKKTFCFFIFGRNGTLKMLSIISNNISVISFSSIISLLSLISNFEISKKFKISWTSLVKVD